MSRRLRRLRAGELIALAGAVCVLVSQFVRDFEGPSGALDGWSTFDAGVVLLLLAAIAALGLCVATLAERSTAIPVAVEVTAIPLALAATIAALVRALEKPGGAHETCFGVWLGLAGAALILTGVWQAMRDEHGPLYPPARPAPRPRPPAGAP
jgi:hypothetical protein